MAVGLAWSPLCLGVIVLHKNLANSTWSNSIPLVIPPMIAKLFICLSLWYLCKAIKLERSYLDKFVLTHVLSLSIINAIWLFIILIYTKVLDVVLKTDTWVKLFMNSYPIFLGVGVSLYFIWALGYYLVLADETLRAREQEVLEQRLFASQAELNALKTTIHPHFLFNSLNMIGPLIGKSPERARVFVAQLAEFLLYSLKYGKKQQVTVRDEVDHISNYLAIETERLGERLKLDLSVDETLLSRPVMPLILLPLVENAVKHGIQQRLEGGLLSISIKPDHVDPAYLSVEIENPYENPPRSVKGEGLGLETLKKRMSAFYGSSARLNILKNDMIFKVELRLPQ
ncbi:MAG: two-component system, LytTR family, sensor kinase [Acidobacteriota bacterium]|nr:two-component system, LytTR family, sensor kinase [Acidobacteriota bacterium]